MPPLMVLVGQESIATMSIVDIDVLLLVLMVLFTCASGVGLPSSVERRLPRASIKLISTTRDVAMVFGEEYYVIMQEFAKAKISCPHSCQGRH